MSISASVTHLEWDGRTINLIDTPGEPSFQADVLDALRVVEGAIVSVSGVMGVEVGTGRALEAMRRARIRPDSSSINLLDRERADFFTPSRRSQPASPSPPPSSSRSAREPEFHGVIDLVHMVAYDHGDEAPDTTSRLTIPDDLRSIADEYHDKLMDVVSETSDELMERYLDGDEITREEMAAAMKKLVTEGELFPVGCGAATRNVGSHGLLDLIVQGLPSPARARESARGRRCEHPRLCVQDDRRPVQRQAQPPARLLRRRSNPTRRSQTTTPAKERIGQLLTIQGKDHAPIEALCTGAIGAVAKLKETGTGDVLSDSEAAADIEPLGVPAPVVSFAIEPKHKGDEEKVVTALRRLKEEDPALPPRGRSAIADRVTSHIPDAAASHPGSGVHPPRA